MEDDLQLGFSLCDVFAFRASPRPIRVISSFPGLELFEAFSYSQSRLSPHDSLRPLSRWTYTPAYLIVEVVVGWVAHEKEKI